METLIKSGILETCAAFPAKVGDIQGGHAPLFSYSLGRGVPMDYVRAHMWFNLAAVKCGADAVKNRDIAAKRLTPQQMAEALKLARECQARDFKGC